MANYENSNTTDAKRNFIFVHPVSSYACL